MPERLAVIGGGISGLSTAYYALKKGYDVELFESSDTLGGLAASFDFEGIQIEKYYHFICGNDTELVALADEIGIGRKVRWSETKLSYYYNGKFYPFGTFWSLLRFSPISFLDRIKFGLNVTTAKYVRQWDDLDRTSARDWLVNSLGERAYNVIWHPLLKVKFGEHYDEVSAAWIWHRIHRVAMSRKWLFAKEKLGYIEGGTQTLLNAIEERINEAGGRIHIRHEVAQMEKVEDRFRVLFSSGKSEEYDKVVLAVPLPTAADIFKNLDPDFSRKLSGIDFIGVLCGVFRLTEGISDSFWLNINDPRIPANGLIEYTNLNPVHRGPKEHVVYIPFYMPLENDWFSRDEQTLRMDFFRILQVLNPRIQENIIKGFRVFKSPFAQAICSVGFKEKMPPVACPVKGAYLIDSTQLYPSDRALSALIGLSKRLTEEHL